ncbi:MAG: adenylyltransferase/cytidyltransferase family protein [Chthoniobacterales bacterium]
MQNSEKIVSLEKLASESQRLKSEGKRLVLTNGCFDILHAGHVRYLQAARERGDALAIALNGDESVRCLKGPERPINPEDDRAEVLAALQAVDYVSIFSEVRATKVIEKVRPGIYAKGGDYTPETLETSEADALKKCGAEIVILPELKGRSTSNILKRGQKKSVRSD